MVKTRIKKGKINKINKKIKIKNVYLEQTYYSKILDLILESVFLFVGTRFCGHSSPIAAACERHCKMEENQAKLASAKCGRNEPKKSRKNFEFSKNGSQF